jgi:predicted ATPase
LKTDGIKFLGEVGTLAVRDKDLDVLTTFKDVGTGLSQVLPIIAILAKSTIDSEIRTRRIRPMTGTPALFEQPELHLHPKMQAELADLFIENSCITNRKFPQIILETHSENLLLRLRKRIREGTISSSDVSVLYVSKSKVNGESVITELQLDSNGDFATGLAQTEEFGNLRLSELM